MFSVFIFGGTTEARLLISYLIDQKIYCTLSVTSNYAKDLIQSSPLLDIKVKSLMKNEIEDVIKDVNPTLIVDATHPYALEVSKNIKNVCRKLNKELILVTRDIGHIEGATVFDNMESLTSFLANNCSNDIVFSTLGIKEAQIFSNNLNNYKEIIYLRILPSIDSLTKATELGFPSSHIICMQGPFSQEMNVLMLQETKAKYLLTKISGKVGGLEAKIEAAKKCGVKVLALKAPIRENGVSLEDAKVFIKMKSLEVK